MYPEDVTDNKYVESTTRDIYRLHSREMPSMPQPGKGFDPCYCTTLYRRSNMNAKTGLKNESEVALTHSHPAMQNGPPISWELENAGTGRTARKTPQRNFLILLLVVAVSMDWNEAGGSSRSHKPPHLVFIFPEAPRVVLNLLWEVWFCPACFCTRTPLRPRRIVYPR